MRELSFSGDGENGKACSATVTVKDTKANENKCIKTDGKDEYTVAACLKMSFDSSEFLFWFFCSSFVLNLIVRLSLRQFSLRQVSCFKRTLSKRAQNSL